MEQPARLERFGDRTGRDGEVSIQRAGGLVIPLQVQQRLGPETLGQDHLWPDRQRPLELHQGRDVFLVLQKELTHFDEGLGQPSRPALRRLVGDRALEIGQRGYTLLLAQVHLSPNHVQFGEFRSAVDGLADGRQRLLAATGPVERLGQVDVRLVGFPIFLDGLLQVGNGAVPLPLVDAQDTPVDQADIARL